jgi:hypothetical protein
MKRHIIVLITTLLSVQIFAVEKWGVFELELEGRKVENPFTDVDLTAEFRFENLTYHVDGFYDGDRAYKIRFMPDKAGAWSYTTSSNIPELDGKSGTFTCEPPSTNNHGPVKVRDTWHFGYADGTPFYVLGTTCYGWVHQEAELIEQTLETLSENDFNKIRMTVMPKSYGTYIQNEPPHYPFEGSTEEGWDFSRLNVAFFRHFEQQIEGLRDLNIEADVILFHPYDKWGFSNGSVEENLLYLEYLVARIGAYRNVWWSMANEYDHMQKQDEEWEKYFRLLMQKDPYQRLRSIHNGTAWYNHSLPWITHISVQTPLLHNVQQWRDTYRKPVINDEFVYEGNIPHNWGNLTPEETVNRFWTIYCRGGYASHGETYEHPENILWWSKGGKLYGKSPERLSFFKRIMEEAPEEPLVPYLHIPWNKDIYLYSGDRSYYLYYYGNSQQSAARLRLPEDKQYRVEVIDAWGMTMDELEGNFSGECLVPLPQKPYIAVRARAIHQE